MADFDEDEPMSANINRQNDYRLIQIITPYLETILEPMDNYLLFTDANFTEFKRIICTNDPTMKDKNIILATKNVRNRYVIDYYKELKPDFNLIIRTPLAMIDSEKVLTINEYIKSNNNIYYFGFTPDRANIYNVIFSQITTEGTVVILGPREERQDNIFFRTEAVDLPDDTEIVYDTLLDNNEQLITLAEAQIREAAFSDVDYVRMCSKEKYSLLEDGSPIDTDKLILELRNYSIDPFLFYEEEEIGALDYHLQRTKMEKLSPYIAKSAFSLLPTLFLLKWQQARYDKYPGIVISLLLEHPKWISSLISFTEITGDDYFDHVRAKRIRFSLLTNFGVGNLKFFLNVLATASLFLDSIEEWTESNYISYDAIFDFSQYLSLFRLQLEGFNPDRIYKQAQPILKEIYQTSVKRKGLQNHYRDSTDGIYHINEDVSVQKNGSYPSRIYPIHVSDDNLINLYVD